MIHVGTRMLARKSREYSPCVTCDGPVERRSPSPLTRIANLVPLHAIVLNRELLGTAMRRFRGCLARSHVKVQKEVVPCPGEVELC
jgi:hypothetical protein